MTKKTITALILGLFLPLSYVSAGTVLSPYLYAWSNNVGYINFENVTVNDSTLGGYAWSTNKGWINFSPSQGGVFNDGTGNLSGSAWGEQLGWIDFDGVSIDPATGEFSGTAVGALVGTLTFDCPTYCDVRTDWRQASSTPPAGTSVGVAGGSGSGGGGGTGGGGGQTPPLVGELTPSPTSEETSALTELIQNATDSAQAKLIDIQEDGIINIIDFNELMADWGSTVCGSPSDMDNDCTVGILDFNIMMVYWGTTYNL